MPPVVLSTDFIFPIYRRFLLLVLGDFSGLWLDANARKARVKNTKSSNKHSELQSSRWQKVKGLIEHVRTSNKTDQSL